MGACDGDCYTSACPDLVDPTTWDVIRRVVFKYLDGGEWVRRPVTDETCFYRKVVDWVERLNNWSDTWGGAGMNTLEWIGHAGGYACHDYSCHNKGRALDVNRIQWNGVACDIYGRDWNSDNRTKRRRYLAVDACCRWHFKYVLDGWYNAQHANHIHVDDARAPVLDKNHESDVVFVQAVCNNFNGAGLTIDGDWGPATQEAWRDLNNAWRYDTRTCDPFTTVSGYRQWLNYVMAHGFADAAARDAIYTTSECYG